MTRIVVAAAIIEHDGRFLITKRQKGVHLEGYWEFPGGKCDPGETIAACVSRELREELDSRPRTRTRIAGGTYILAQAGCVAHPGRWWGRKCDGPGGRASPASRFHPRTSN